MGFLPGFVFDPGQITAYPFRQENNQALFDFRQYPKAHPLAFRVCMLILKLITLNLISTLIPF